MSNVVINDAGQELRVGDVWALRRGYGLEKMKITALTQLTVELMSLPMSYIKTLYEIREIKFIEKISEG